MKTLLPCPRCSQFFLPPDSIASGAILECPGCRFQSVAEGVFLEIPLTTRMWTVVDQPSIENVAAINAVRDQTGSDENLDGVLAEDNFSAIDEDHGFVVSGEIFEDTLPFGQNAEEPIATTGAEVPLSNEWETQSASLDTHESPLEGLVEDAAEEEFLIDDDSVVTQQEISNSKESGDSVQMMFEEDSIIHDLHDAVETDEDLESIDELEFMESSALEFSSTDSEQEPREADEAPLVLAPLERSPTRVADPLNPSGKPPRKRKQESPVKLLAQVVGGGFAAVPLAILLMWYWLGTDPLKVGPMVAQFAPWIVPSQLATNSSFLPSSSTGGSNSSLGSRKMPQVQMQPSAPVREVDGPTSDKPIDIAVEEPRALARQSSAVSEDLSANLPVFDPSQSIAKLSDALASDSTANGYAQSVFEAMGSVGKDLFALHLEGSPAFKTWQQAATKATSPVAKNGKLLVGLKKLSQAAIDSAGLEPASSEKLALQSGFNLVKVGEINASETGEEWIPTADSQKLWTSTRIIVPKSVGRTGEVNRAYLLIGGSQATSADSDGITTDFTVLVAIPL